VWAKKERTWHLISIRPWYGSPRLMKKPLETVVRGRGGKTKKKKTPDEPPDFFKLRWRHIGTLVEPGRNQRNGRKRPSRNWGTAPYISHTDITQRRTIRRKGKRKERNGHRQSKDPGNSRERRKKMSCCPGKGKRPRLGLEGGIRPKEEKKKAGGPPRKPEGRRTSQARRFTGPRGTHVGKPPRCRDK